MAPRIPASLAVLDALCCMGLGFLAAFLRALLPCRRHAAATFAADFLAVGFGLVLGQGYAARQAAAGELRWYMVAALVLGAAAAQKLLAPRLAALRRAAMAVLLWPLRRAAAGIRSQRAKLCRAAMQRKNEKSRRRAIKKAKKQLPNKQKVLYNSNVSYHDPAVSDEQS